MKSKYEQILFQRVVQSIEVHCILTCEEVGSLSTTFGPLTIFVNFILTTCILNCISYYFNGISGRTFK
jgi:hypothetical protein